MTWLNLRDLPQRAVLSKDLTTDQTLYGLFPIANSANLGFTAGGLGSGVNTSSTSIIAAIGGFDDQRVLGTMRFTSDPASGTIGLIARATALHTLGGDSYHTHYLARIQGGNARISKVVDNVFGSALASEPFDVPVDEDFTIDMSVVGATVTAVFTHDVLGEVTLSWTDPDPIQGGCVGFRTTTGVSWELSSIEGWQL